MTQQRVKNNREIRESIRLLTMRDQIRDQLGESYSGTVERFVPFVTAQLRRYGCPRVAAAHVCELLETQMAVDPAIKRLVMCAALDVALRNTETSLAG
jgi:hypothetical protein